MSFTSREAIALFAAGNYTRLEASQPAIRPLDPVRVGFVGVGVKGSQHLRNLLHIEGVEIRAVCDIFPEACRQAQAAARALGRPEPEAYPRGERDFERLCDLADLDLVYTAAPWRWHTPMCLAADLSARLGRPVALPL